MLVSSDTRFDEINCFQTALIWLRLSCVLMTTLSWTRPLCYLTAPWRSGWWSRCVWGRTSWSRPSTATGCPRSTSRSGNWAHSTWRRPSIITSTGNFVKWIMDKTSLSHRILDWIKKTEVWLTTSLGLGATSLSRIFWELCRPFVTFKIFTERLH